MCLASVLALTPQPTEIIIVANGDTQSFGRLAEEMGTSVLNIPEAVGPAQARNLGAKEANGEILLFIDADVTIQNDAISQVIDFFQDHPEIAAVFGSYDDEPFETNFLSQYKNLLHHYVHQTGNEEATTFWAGCGAIRRDVFLKIGGFDESYRHPCIEDIELGYRLKKAGYRIRLLKSLQVKHLKHWTPFSLLKADIFYRALPWTALILRDRQFINDLNLKTSSRISVVTVYLLIICLLAGTFHGWLIFPALFWASLLVVLNRDVYQFFLKKRGVRFTIMTIPWHWLYFFYSGAAFAVGILKYRMRMR